MTKKIKNITRDLKSRRNSLLKRYEEEDLHKLRVNIRRIRGLLKQCEATRASSLSKEWKRLVRQTSAARDWDTFAGYVEATVDAEDFQLLKPLLKSNQKKAHRQARRMLKSGDWLATMEKWKLFLQKTGKDSFTKPSLNDTIEPTHRRVNESRYQALNWGDEASWHRFRIAVKELRYTLDNLDPQNAEHQNQVDAEIEICKQLQDDLGDWHDTVVHRELLARLAEDPRVQRDSQVEGVINALGNTIRTRATSCLEHVKVVLDANELIVKPKVQTESAIPVATPTLKTG